MILYGGIPLAFPTPGEIELAESFLDDPAEFETADYTTARRDAWNRPGLRDPRPFTIGKLFWPTGAERFAFIRLLATKDQLDKIRPLVYDQNVAGKYKSITLKLDDGQRSIETKLWMLPPRPLAQLLNDPNQYHLITLVDDRYFWWEKAASIAITGGTTTWQNLFDSIGTALGVSIANEAVNAYYLKPSEDLENDYQFLPLLLDAVCKNVGQVFVRKLNGTCITQGPVTARTSQDAQVDAYTKMLGGKFLFRQTDTPKDLQALVPADFKLIFPQTDATGIPQSGSYVVTKTLVSLTLPEFAGITGHTGTHFVHDTAVYDTTNATELDNLTIQQAKDWYRFRLGKADIAYPGIVPYLPEGLSDYVEWSIGQTRVQRPPWMDLSENYNRYGTGAVGSATVGEYDFLTVTNTITLGGGKGTDTVTPGILTGPTPVGTNIPGTNLYIKAPPGTGSADDGKILIQTTIPKRTGTTTHTYETAIELNDDGMYFYGLKYQPCQINAIKCQVKTYFPETCIIAPTTFTTDGNTVVFSPGAINPISAYDSQIGDRLLFEAGADTGIYVIQGNGGRLNNTNYNYVYSTNVAESDPGAGGIKFNNTTFSSATQVYISTTDSDTNDLFDDYFASWGNVDYPVRGVLRIAKASDPTNHYALFEVESDVTDNLTWVKFTVDETATVGTIGNGVAVTISFTPTAAWVRADDFNETAEVAAGMIVAVTDGFYEDTLWMLVNDDSPDAIVLNTTMLSFSLVGRKGGLYSGVNDQTGQTTYEVVDDDWGKLVVFGDADPVAVDLTSPACAGFGKPREWMVEMQNFGPSLVTITPASGTIDGGSSLELPYDEGVRIFSNGGTAFFTQRGMDKAIGSMAGIDDWYHQVTTTARYYYIGTKDGEQNNPSTPFSITDNLIFAWPWRCRRTGVIDRIEFKAGTAPSANSKIQLALYANSTDIDLYPAARIANFGEITIDTTSNKIYPYAGLTQAVTAGTLYWWAINCDIASGAPTLFGFTANQIVCLLGNNGSFTSPGDSHSYLGTRTYAAGMPDPFADNGSPTLVPMAPASSGFPAFTMRYSS